MLKSTYDCIVLDLDGTLVYSSEEEDNKAINIIFKDRDGDMTELWVHKRPGFDEFLTKCFSCATVGIWSMGQPGYVKEIASLFPQQPAFIYNWCDCDRNKGKIFKRLDNIPHQGRIVMIDDRRDILESCDRVNIIIVPEWNYINNNDRTLYNISSLLFDQ